MKANARHAGVESDVLAKHKGAKGRNVPLLGCGWARYRPVYSNGAVSSLGRAEAETLSKPMLRVHSITFRRAHAKHAAML